MTKPLLKYWFEWSAPSPLWANNEAAYREFDAASIPLEVLPIQPELRAELEQLCWWHDTALNWDSPTDPGLWRQNEHNAFYAEAKKALDSLRDQLGDRYDFVSQVYQGKEDPNLDNYLRDKVSQDYRSALRITNECGHEEVWFEKVDDDQKVADLKSMVKGIIREERFKLTRLVGIDYNWIASHECIVSIKKRVKNENCVSRLSRSALVYDAFSNKGLDTVYGVDLELEEQFSPIYRVDVRPEGIMQVYPICTTALFSEDMTSMVVNTYSSSWINYDLFVGSRTFVEKCLGMSSKAAYDQLIEDVEMKRVPELVRKDLMYYAPLWPR